ncbi:MAG: DEAD/DEAH box helicase [Proteobacteria bacterium]|nr:DEAD/DEAH box helicase [Pseudomonadota bacterium]
MTSFADFALLAPLQKALAAEGYTQPTPIQAQTVPQALAGRDVLGIAQTGTGKTAAFALPILHRLGKSGTTRKPRSCRALILSPTRELASQIADSFRAYGKFMHLSIDVVFGGIPIARQIKRLATGADILVATPGRLLDLIDQKALTLRELEVLVLDEADQMLDLGFIHALRRIIPMLPKQRQSLFFSATMPQSIGDLAHAFLTDPVKVAVTPVATTAERVTQGVMFVPQAAKQGLLAKVLEDATIERVLVFTRTKHGADRVVKFLARDGIEAAAIHGNKSQVQRERALGAFRNGTCRVLVATDIAARGIDVEGVTHVINFELPNVPDSYVHRIGRTARAGASGIALSFCAGDERAFLRDIERLTRLPIPVLAVPEGVPMDVATIQEAQPKGRGQGRPQQGGRGGQGARPGNAGRSGGGGRPQQGGRGEHAGRADHGGRPGGSSERPEGRPDARRDGQPARRPRRRRPNGGQGEGGGRRDGTRA